MSKLPYLIGHHFAIWKIHASKANFLALLQEYNYLEVIFFVK